MAYQGMTGAGAAVAERQVIDGDVWFMNLPALVRGGLPETRGPGDGWHPLSHAIDVGDAVGVCIGSDAPDQTLTLELGLTGWHVIHIGQNPALRVWLEGEEGYCELPGDGSVVRDTAMPPLDLTGRRLCIAPVRSQFHRSHVTVFYIRAEPCQEPVAHRNLVATNDGHGVFHRGMDSPRDVYSHIYLFRNSGIFRVLWGTYGGSTLTLNPASKFKDLTSRPMHLLVNQGSVTFQKSINHFAAKGYDALKIVRDATREYGMELHYYFRMAAFYGPYPHYDWTYQFFRDHPELRCITETGEPINMLSYAYRETQDHVLAFFEELLDYEPEGICLAFNRGLPLVLFEQPVLEAFKRRTGRDAVLPGDAHDPDMLAVRNELLMGFVRRARELTDRRGAALSCVAPRDFEHSRELGLDIHEMVRQRLFESVHIGAGHGDKGALSHDLAPLEPLKGHGVKIYAGGSRSPAHGLAWELNQLQGNAQKMKNILEAGYDGGWFWDADHVFGYDRQGMCAMGDRERLEQMIAGTWPARTRHETLRVNDLVVGRYNPWHAY